jgi:hypothetical protein
MDFGYGILGLLSLFWNLSCQMEDTYILPLFDHTENCNQLTSWFSHSVERNSGIFEKRTHTKIYGIDLLAF